MPIRQVELRYPGTCSGCAAGLARGETAWWDVETKAVTCPSCRYSIRTAVANHGVDPGSLVEDHGAAGGSAQAEYHRRHRLEQKRLEEKWGCLAAIAALFRGDTQRAWAKGAAGERRVGHVLERNVGEDCVVLHDRRVNGRPGNIDHLVIASSGVWIIDAKNYRGKVERRNVGGVFERDERLYVGGKDRSSLVQGLGWQVSVVAQALLDPRLPIHPVLCFAGCTWGLLAPYFRIGGVTVAAPRCLAKAIKVPGPLDTAAVQSITTTLVKAL